MYYYFCFERTNISRYLGTWCLFWFVFFPSVCNIRVGWAQREFIIFSCACPLQGLAFTKGACQRGIRRDFQYQSCQASQFWTACLARIVCSSLQKSLKETGLSDSGMWHYRERWQKVDQKGQCRLNEWGPLHQNKGVIAGSGLMWGKGDT